MCHSISQTCRQQVHRIRDGLMGAVPVIITVAVAAV